MKGGDLSGADLTGTGPTASQHRGCEPWGIVDERTFHNNCTDCDVGIGSGIAEVMSICRCAANADSAAAPTEAMCGVYQTRKNLFQLHLNVGLHHLWVGAGYGRSSISCAMGLVSKGEK